MKRSPIEFTVLAPLFAIILATLLMSVLTAICAVDPNEFDVTQMSLLVRISLLLCRPAAHLCVGGAAILAILLFERFCPNLHRRLAFQILVASCFFVFVCIMFALMILPIFPMGEVVSEGTIKEISQQTPAGDVLKAAPEE